MLNPSLKCTILILSLSSSIGCSGTTDGTSPESDELSVADGSAAITGAVDRYLGQLPPGREPQIFAPGQASFPDVHEFGSVFSADGLALYYGVQLRDRAEIRGIFFENGQWQPPVPVVSDPQFGANDPFLSPNEDRLYFISNRPLADGGPAKDIDIWYLERQAGGWSPPINAGPAINSERDEYYISFTDDGALYFASNVAAGAERSHDFDLYVAQPTPGGFAAPERLAGEINTPGYEADAFVAPDGRYIIFSSSRKDGFGRGDLYVSVRRDDGTWSEGRHLDSPINTEGHELCPFVTRDGRYFFYTSNQDLFWVDAAVLEPFLTMP